MNLEDDLKKYEVHIDTIPIWYFDTVREFITSYCPDMHWKNKVLLFELLNKIEPKPDGNPKVVELKRKAV
jgi:hypothetical protein